MRGSSARALGEASCRSLVRRMINLPRTIIDECSRVIDQGKGLIRIGSRRRPENLHSQQPLNFPFQDPSFFPPTVQEEWAFLASFEQQYGTTHPFFYACRFKDAMKIAADEHKFMFMYIHSPEHPFTPSFCRETLCSEIVVQFLDANFISWGGLASGGEGLQMANALRACTFPFCAVVAPASGDDNLSVLQQVCTFTLFRNPLFLSMTMRCNSCLSWWNIMASFVWKSGECIRQKIPLLDFVCRWKVRFRLQS